MTKSTKDNDALFLAFQEKVKQKKAELEGLSKPSYKTKQVFTIDNKTYNFNVLTEKELVTFYSACIVREQSFKFANTALETNLKFDLEGYSLEDIKHDVALKINIKRRNQKEKELKELEELIESQFSAEMKKQKTLEEIEKKLNNL